MYLYLVEIIYMLFFTSGMVYTALSNPSIFIDIRNILEAFPRPDKYLYAKLTEVQIEEILAKVESCMKLDKPYFSPHLTLATLADRLELEPRHISQVVNDRIGQNFKDYINTYRIEEAKRILDQPDQDLRIFEVMYHVGFNSKSSFNLFFKRHTGLTPTVYRKHVLKEHIQH